LFAQYVSARDRNNDDLDVKMFFAVAVCRDGSSPLETVDASAVAQHQPGEQVFGTAASGKDPQTLGAKGEDAIADRQARHVQAACG
jgi:hypothetical protein